MSMKSITSLAKKIFFISKAVILLHFYLDIMPTGNAKILSDSEEFRMDLLLMSQARYSNYNDGEKKNLSLIAILR